MKKDVNSGVIAQLRHSFTWTAEDGKTHDRLFKVVFKAVSTEEEAETPFMIYHANWESAGLKPMTWYRWYEELENGESVCRFAIGNR